MSKKIKNIVFDFGNVLIDWNPRYLFCKIFDTKEKLDYFMDKEWAAAEWNDPLDRGETLEDTKKAMLAKYPHLQREINAYYTRYFETIGSPLYETVALLYDLQKAGFATYGLTNWSNETFSVVRKELHFFDTLDGIVISGVEKIIKPDSRIYEILLNRYELKPEETIFIDDREQNLIPARALGINTVLFTNVEDVRKAIQKMS
ncbi:MAG: HAD family phosphatase [Prevotellaceae bacterium]|jgi:2-haloacid dehalogenase|nr:HAD family phosphatase [Prevotellaceae bacterium]